MGDTTAIEWTDHTFNPWWGCVKVSRGCRHCYADSLSSRYGHDVWGTKKPRRFLSDSYWHQPVHWNAEAASGVPGVRGDIGRHLVFCASMADVFEDYRGPDAERLVLERKRLFELIEDTPCLDWQLLTKRPENVAEMVPWGNDWPANVWLGTSVEHQAAAEQRIPELADAPAAVRFLSCEPLVGPVDLATEIAFDRFAGGFAHAPMAHVIDWVIIGGESGGKAAPMDLEWARLLITQSRASGVAPFVKQLGTVWARGGLSAGYKGGDWGHWPADLRIREFPAGAA